jgi:hypothetical protein
VALSERNTDKLDPPGNGDPKVDPPPVAKAVTDAAGAEAKAEKPAGQPSAEMREQMRKRFESATPEEREAMLKNIRERNPGGTRVPAQGGAR